MTHQPDPPPGIFTQIRPLATYGRRALALVWATSPLLTFALAFLTLAAGLLPASIAYVGKFLVDSVVAAIEDNSLPTRSGSGCRWKPCWSPPWPLPRPR